MAPDSLRRVHRRGRCLWQRLFLGFATLFMLALLLEILCGIRAQDNPEGFRSMLPGGGQVLKVLVGVTAALILWRALLAGKNRRRRRV